MVLMCHKHMPEDRRTFWKLLADGAVCRWRLSGRTIAIHAPVDTTLLENVEKIQRIWARWFPKANLSSCKRAMDGQAANDIGKPDCFSPAA